MEKRYQVVPVRVFRVSVNGKVNYYTHFIELGDDYAKVMSNGKWGILTPSGNIWGEIEYDEIFNFSEDIIRVKKGEKFGYLDRKTGRVISRCVYDKAFDFNNGIAKVFIEGKYRHINVIGKFID